MRTSRALFVLSLACTSVASARGLLRVGEEQSPGTLNPLYPNDMFVVRATELLFSGLAGYNLANQVTEPRLAHRWELLEDGAKVRFHIDVAAAWHDGTPVTSADVVFTVNAMRANAPWFRTVVAGATADGPQVVTIDLVRRRDKVAEALEDLTFKIVPAHLFPGGKVSPISPFAQDPVGAGPFRLSGRAGNSIDLLRFDKRRPAPAKLDGISLTSTPDPKVHKDAIKAENLGLLVRVPPKDVKELRRISALNVFEYASLDWWYLAHNHNRPHTRERAFRQAITWSLDLENLRQAHLGDGHTLSGPFAHEDLRNPQAVPPPTRQMSKARSLLEERGYKFDPGSSTLSDASGDPVKLVLLVQPPLGAVEALFTDLTSQFRELGIELEVRKPPDLTAWRAEARSGKGYDLVLGRWFPTPGDYLSSLFHSKGEENWFGYRNKQVDQKLEDLTRAPDGSTYLKGLRELHQMLWDDQPYTFLWSLKGYSAYNQGHFENVYRIHPFYYFSHVHTWDQRPRGRK